MTCRAVIGLQWGDEGKGKVVDIHAGRADVVVRYAGGANAGHTVVVDGRKLVSHLVPSGAFHAEPVCVIGAGVVVDPTALLAEVAEFERAGIHLGGRLLVSERAHVVFDYHKMRDQMAESASGAAKLGTTGRGIGPCYADKARRAGLRVVDLYDEQVLRSRVAANLEAINRRLAAAGREALDLSRVLDATGDLARRIRPWVADAETYVLDALDGGRDVLFEGAQGTLLDIDLGTYPYVTSSNAGAGGIPSGTGAPLRAVEHCLGVTKAYTTRVGEGPFPTELLGPEGDRLREVGSEYGATTGRPRRCGWLDGVALRYACRVNGVDALAIMKLDCLSGVDPIPVCTRYRIGGEETDRFPAGLSALASARPVYETMPGFREDVSGARRLTDLPPAARAYLDRIEAIAGAPIAMVSVGPGREQTIELA